MPFEHLGSNNVPSFIFQDDMTDPVAVEHCSGVVFQQRRWIFLQLHLVLARVLIKGDRHRSAWKRGGEMVVAIS